MPKDQEHYVDDFDVGENDDDGEDNAKEDNEDDNGNNGNRMDDWRSYSDQKVIKLQRMSYLSWTNQLTNQQMNRHTGF